MTHKELIEKLVWHTNTGEIAWQQPVNNHDRTLGYFQAAFCGLHLHVRYAEFEHMVAPQVTVAGVHLLANAWPLLDSINVRQGQCIPSHILEHLLEEPA